MDDLLVAVGLVLVIEGLLWAALPQFGIKLLAAAVETPESALRAGGTVAILLGMAIVWFIRG